MAYSLSFKMSGQRRALLIGSDDTEQRAAHASLEDHGPKSGLLEVCHQAAFVRVILGRRGVRAVVSLIVRTEGVR